MCIILQGCENPTETGVWWRDDVKWYLYSPEHQNLIRRGLANDLHSIDLGKIVSAKHPDGWHYTVDLDTMQQVAVLTGQGRSVMVVDSSTPRCPLSAAPPRQANLLPPRHRFSMQVHYRDTKGNMHLYHEDVAAAILKGMKSRSQHTLLVRDERSEGHIVFDLEAMRQYVVDHFNGDIPVLSDLAPVEVVVEIPWDPTAMASMAVKADKCMRRKRYTRDESLDAILPVKAHPRTVVSKSTSSSCEPGNPLYEKFIDSLEAELEMRPTEVFGAVIQQASMTETSTDGPVQMAFKTAEASGSATQVTAFWTSMAAPVAAANAHVYGCAVQLKVLAYLVILPAADAFRRYASFGDRCSGCIQVHKPEHQLPVAEVTVS